MLAYLRALRDRRTGSLRWPCNDPHLMICCWSAVHRVGDFIEPVPHHHHLSWPLVNSADAGPGTSNGSAYGRGADRTIGVRLITPPYGLVLLLASKFVGSVFGKALRAALPIYDGVPGHDYLYDLFPQGRAVAAEAGDPGIGGLFQIAGGDRIYLSEYVVLVVPAKAATHTALCSRSKRDG